MDRASREQVAANVLRVLYAARFVSEDEDYIVPYADLPALCHATAAEVNRADDRLCSEGLVDQVGQCGYLTSDGIAYAEEHGLADPRVRERNQQVRSLIVLACADLYDQTGQNCFRQQAIVERAGITDREFDNNFRFLMDHGRLGETGMQGAWEITPEGQDEADHLR